MLRLALLVATLSLIGCTSARTSALVATDSNDAIVVMAPIAESVPPPVAAAKGGDDAESSGALGIEAPLDDDASELTGHTYFSGPAQESLHASRFTIKGGYYGSEEDDLDDGLILNLSWMTFRSKMFAVEFEIGYIDADGSNDGVDTDLWSVPVMVNGRLNVPIWVLDLYGGLGIGGFYNDMEQEGGSQDGSSSSCLFGGNAFLGATINVADAIALGLEAKYYVTDEVSKFDTSLDAFALMLTLGFSR